LPPSLASLLPSQGDEKAEKDVEKWDKAIRLNPDYVKEQEEAAAKWAKDNKGKCDEVTFLRTLLPSLSPPPSPNPPSLPPSLPPPFLVPRQGPSSFPSPPPPPFRLQRDGRREGEREGGRGSFPSFHGLSCPLRRRKGEGGDNTEGKVLEYGGGDGEEGRTGMKHRGDAVENRG
jgi:hypothetical protein